MRKIVLACILVVTSFLAKANNVQITNLVKSGSTISFDITWENSWRSTMTYHDAIWVFVKQAANGGPSWEHANVTSATVDTDYETVVPGDQVGFFLRRSSNGNGTASTSVTATLSGLNGAFQDIKVMGIEMVYVPNGSFYAGDGYSIGRIARGDDNSQPFEIVDNSILTCGSSSSDIQFAIGGCVDIPVSYPKGYESFYCMKYVITQKQYVDFLNCLSRPQQENRVTADITGTSVTNVFVLTDQITPVDGNVVRCDSEIGNGDITFYCDRNNNGTPNEFDDGMSRACNYLRITDWSAYLDWSGLRPWTFLEVEKASRGPNMPVPNEKSWGSTLTNYGENIVYEGMDLERWSNSYVDGGIITHSGDVVRVGCNAPFNSATRELSGASFYGIIDIGNNPSDWYVTNNDVSTYTGIEGDGSLDLLGNENVIGWPAFDADIFNEMKTTNSALGISVLGVSTPAGSKYSGGRGVRSNF